MPSARKKARFGDVFEVRTPRGRAYLQYTSNHPEYSDTVRVLPGLFDTRPSPEALASLVAQEGYFTFYRVALAVRHGLVEFIGSYPVPAGLEAPSRLLRAGFTAPGGKVMAWIVEEGSRETLLKRALTPEEKRLSRAQMWNHEYLVQRLAEQWRPEHEHEPRPPSPEVTPPPQPSGQRDSPAAAPSPGKPLRMSHYLYFPLPKDGKAVAAELRRRGFEVDSRKGADGVNWLVLVHHALSSSEDPTGLTVRDELEHLAQQYSGEYDGSETALPE